MGCLKLKYLENPSPLKVVYRANEAEQKPVQGFWSIDPLSVKYAYNSPYAFSENRLIDKIELEGLEASDHLYNARVREYAKGNITAEQLNAAIDYHTALDIIGTVPILGEAADALNALLYSIEGDYENAGLSFAGMIPFAGWGATGAKWARNALKYSDNAFHSASGLVFKQGSKHGNRLSHVMAHTANDLSKAKHGVFNVGEDKLVSTLDEAWEMAQKGGDNVTKTVQENGNVSYVIDMGREVGYEGGKKGSGEALNRINIVVEKGTSDVVTAFPTQ